MRLQRNRRKVGTCMNKEMGSGVRPMMECPSVWDEAGGDLNLMKWRKASPSAEYNYKDNFRNVCRR